MEILQNCCITVECIYLHWHILIPRRLEARESQGSDRQSWCKAREWLVCFKIQRSKTCAVPFTNQIARISAHAPAVHTFSNQNKEHQYKMHFCNKFSFYYTWFILYKLISIAYPKVNGSPTISLQRDDFVFVVTKSNQNNPPFKFS